MSTYQHVNRCIQHNLNCIVYIYFVQAVIKIKIMRKTRLKPNQEITVLAKTWSLVLVSIHSKLLHYSKIKHKKQFSERSMWLQFHIVRNDCIVYLAWVYIHSFVLLYVIVLLYVLIGNSKMSTFVHISSFYQNA